MFNVGSEDKEKLRENMEEIKNLIQGKEDNSSQEPPAQENNELGSIEDNGIAESNLDNNPPLNQSSEDEGFQADNSQGDIELDDSQGSTDFSNDNTLQDNSSGNLQQDTSSNNLGNQPPASENSFEPGNNEPEQNLGTPNNQNKNQFNQQEKKQEELTTNNPSSRKQDRSEKLFLEVERFEKVKDMIDEMQQLTQDIETTSQDLEEQIDDERESENVAQQLLDNFDDRKREVEGIVLDSEEN
jgi:hypothetical protein